MGVNVANAGYAAAEVPVTVRTATNSTTERVFIPARGKAIERILVSGPPTQVQLNDGTVPEAQASVHVTDISNIPIAPATTGPTPHKLPRDDKN